ncbi:MAG: hypothetical protein KGP10_02465 [Actinomycetales bacterium]|nr:hypothetical protein [Actinomycetales bacterium]
MTLITAAGTARRTGTAIRALAAAGVLATAASLTLVGPAAAISYDSYKAKASAPTLAIGDTVTITGKTASKSTIGEDKPYPGPGDTLCAYRYVAKPSKNAKLGNEPWPAGVPGWQQLDDCTTVQANGSFSTTLSIGTAGLGKQTYVMGNGDKKMAGMLMLPENVAASSKFTITGTK